MNVATPGTDLPLAGMTTDYYGHDFTFWMWGTPHRARVITKDGARLVRTDLMMDFIDHAVYIVCDGEEDQRYVRDFILGNEGPCAIRSRHHHDGIQFLWMHIGYREYAIRAVSR